MKKWLLIILLGVLFWQGLRWFNAKVNEEMFSDFYESDYALSDADQDNGEPNLWEKIKDWYNEKFGDKDEQYIYR